MCCSRWALSSATGGVAAASADSWSDADGDGDGTGRQHGRQRGAERDRESTLFATITTDASCGAVNAMHDSFTPLGGMIPLVNIMLGEVVFGGVGSGLYGMLIFVVLRCSSPG